jgi:uncharacterized protein (TIGR04255 family)
MGELLKSETLVEALCEFHFDLSGDNELTLPGLFYAQVRNEFPIQTSANELAFHIEFGDEQEMQKLIQAQRLQLKRKDGSAMLQVAQNRLIINQLQPYAGWDNFKSLILEGLKKYINVCGEFVIKKTSLRYINHIIPQPNEEFEIDDFLTIIPLFPNPLEKPITEFQQVYEFFYDSGAFLTHRTGIAENSDGLTVLILDLDFTSQEIENFQDNLKTCEWLEEWLNQAHNHIEAVFISSLNSSYYQSLKYEES